MDFKGLRQANHLDKHILRLKSELQDLNYKSSLTLCTRVLVNEELAYRAVLKYNETLGNNHLNRAFDNFIEVYKEVLEEELTKLEKEFKDL